MEKEREIERENCFSMGFCVLSEEALTFKVRKLDIILTLDFCGIFPC